MRSIFKQKKMLFTLWPFVFFVGAILVNLSPTSSSVADILIAGIVVISITVLSILGQPLSVFYDAHGLMDYGGYIGPFPTLAAMFVTAAAYTIISFLVLLVFIKLKNKS